MTGGLNWWPQGQVRFEPSIRVVDYAARVSEGRLEVREFVRGAPVVEFDLPGIERDGTNGIFRGANGYSDFSSTSARVAAALWQEPERQFAFRPSYASRSGLRSGRPV